MIKNNIDNAISRIGKYVRKTPFEHSSLISNLTGVETCQNGKSTVRVI